MSSLWGDSILGLELLETPEKVMNFASNFGIGVEIQQAIIVTIMALEYFFNFYDTLFGTNPSQIVIGILFIYVVFSSLGAIALISNIRNQPRLYANLSCPICNKGVYIPIKLKCNRCGSDISPNQTQRNLFK